MILGLSVNLLKNENKLKTLQRLFFENLTNVFINFNGF